MFISKKISSIIVILALLAGSSGLNAYVTAVSAQDKKKSAERKVKRTTRETTKGKAKAKPKAVKSVMQPLVVKKTFNTNIVAKQPAIKRYQAMPPIDITTLPAPMNVSSSDDMDMPPMDLPAKLSVALIAMLPNNVQNRVENIIASNLADSQNMFKNIYLLAWVDDELMKKMNSSDFYSTLLTVISQECNVPYGAVETMAAPVKDQIDTTLTRFENAVIAGDTSNFDIQLVRDLFRGEDSYTEYLERCLRLANEYKQSKMVTVLKLAIANAGSGYSPAQEEDFNY